MYPGHKKMSPIDNLVEVQNTVYLCVTKKHSYTFISKNIIRKPLFTLKQGFIDRIIQNPHVLI